jgi:hypothetical protein
MEYSAGTSSDYASLNHHDIDSRLDSVVNVESDIQLYFSNDYDHNHSSSRSGRSGYHNSYGHVDCRTGRELGKCKRGWRWFSL